MGTDENHRNLATAAIRTIAEGRETTCDDNPNDPDHPVVVDSTASWTIGKNGCPPSTIPEESEGTSVSPSGDDKETERSPSWDPQRTRPDGVESTLGPSEPSPPTRG